MKFVHKVLLASNCHRFRLCSGTDLTYVKTSKTDMQICTWCKFDLQTQNTPLSYNTYGCFYRVRLADVTYNRLYGSDVMYTFNFRTCLQSTSDAFLNLQLLSCGKFIRKVPLFHLSANTIRLSGFIKSVGRWTYLRATVWHERSSPSVAINLYIGRSPETLTPLLYD